tara:strand:+ start:17459 stop:17698 length:240 start_codon:yes stop_codon:yes gene_type:complete
MKKCLQTCKDIGTTCPITECRYWIDFPKDLNCTFETIDNNGALTLREASERLGISYVRVKQIEDQALKKISLLLKDIAI